MATIRFHGFTWLSLVVILCFPIASIAYADKSTDDAKVDFGVSRSDSKRGIISSFRGDRQISVVATQDWPFRWQPDPTKPISRVEVKLAEQRVYFYQGNLLVGDAPVSTGNSNHTTPAGQYKVLVKELQHFSNQYGELVNAKGRIVSYSAEAGDPIPKGLRYVSSPMPYYLRITDGGIGLHEGFLPGYAASHGCIRVPKNLAPLMFESIPVGTPVVIIPGIPDSPTPKVANK